MPVEQPQGAIRRLLTGTIASQAFSGDGKTLYTVRNGAVTAYDVATGSSTASWVLGNQLGGIDLSADGRYMVVTELGPERRAPRLTRSTASI